MHARNRDRYAQLLTRHNFTGIWDKNFKKCYAYSKIHLGIEFHQPNQYPCLWSAPFVSSCLFLWHPYFMHEMINIYACWVSLFSLIKFHQSPNEVWSQLKAFHYFLTYIIMLFKKKSYIKMLSVLKRQTRDNKENNWSLNLFLILNSLG